MISARPYDNSPSGAESTVLHPHAAKSGILWAKRTLLLVVLIWTAGLFIGYINSLKFLVVLGFALSIAGLRTPVLGVLGIGILCTIDAPVRVYLLTGGLWRWNTFNYLLLLVILSSFPFLRRLRDMHSLFLALFCTLLGIEILVGSSYVIGTQHLLGIFITFGLLRYFINVVNNDDAWYWMALICGLVSALGGLIFFIQKGNLPYINHNAWSFLPLTGIFTICLAYRFIVRNRRKVLVLMLLASINFVWVFLSGSRSGLLIGLCAMIFLNTAGKKFFKNFMLSAVLIMSGVLLANQFDEQQSFALERIHKLFDTERSVASRTSGRSDLALAGLAMFKEQPLGVGTGGYSANYIRVAEEHGLGLADRHEQAHSGWIKVLAENGFPGICLMLGYVFSFAVVGWRKRRQGLFVLGILVTISLIVPFTATEFQGKGLWLLASASTVLLHKEFFSRLFSRLQKKPDSLRYQ